MRNAVLILSVWISLAAVAGQPQEAPTRFPVLAGTMGCRIEKITDRPHNEYQFQGASPDGVWLSYAWNEGEDQDGKPIYGAHNLNLLTGEIRGLVDPINNSGTFSRDGRYLVGAQYTAENRTDIYELDLETGEARAIASDPQSDWLPSYSPDGRFILFNSYRTGNSELYLWNRSGKTLRQLTEYSGYDAQGEFSPDGRKVLFHRMVRGLEEGRYDFDLYSIDLASGEETRLTSTPFEESYASWSPDGRHFVFSSDFEEQPEKHNLYVMDSSGEIVAQLTDGDWSDTYSYWTRDGAYIYFNSDRSGNTDIYRMRMDGTNCAKAD